MTLNLTTTTNSPKTTMTAGILVPGKGGAIRLHVSCSDLVHEQIGQLPLSETAITWLRQIPGILDTCWKHGIPRKQQTNKVRDTLQDLRAALEVAPAAFSGCANLKANSIRVGSLVIAKGPYGYLGVQVWRRDDDGYERGLGPQGCVLGASPAKATSFFADQHAEPALTLIRDILCAPDVLIRACAREKF